MSICRTKIEIHRVHPNEGQIQGLPKNPRFIKDEKFRKLCKSILSLPEMTEARDILVYPYSDEYIVIGGNMRLQAYKHLGWKEVPCCVLPEDISVEKLRQMLIQDNNPLGENDWDALANEWDSDELEEWGFDVWQEAKQEKQSQKQKELEDKDAIEEPDFFNLMLGDRIYDSNNEFDIPNLRFDCQPTSGLLLPFAGWGSDTRTKKGISTYHFYVEDYRFKNMWNNPVSVLESGCTELVEPNLSLFDTTPIAYGLQQIYMKRWIARYWQECGAKVYADLNVAQKFYQYNRLGIPDRYNAFATRGYADRQEYLKMEIQIAREISGKDNPNMVVYGGGEEIKELCIKNNVLYVEQFMANRAKQIKKGGKNG
ncbi:DUF4417 domain-containing protein [Parabacteroides pacaensis]|uniref:DUF4417 domain-containing protein n=1 Tax=Parabacteroides pacaensis TaxID=2086575 RepID=UPI001F23EFE8|nr:DUF4417 domain-containing protein [Parabacteroides pacaensis]